MNNSKPLALLLAAVAALAASSGVIAAPAPQSIAVGYADLDLGRPSGVAKLNKRVRRAAARLCDLRSVRPLADYLARRDCMIGTVQAARAQVEQALAADPHSRLAARDHRPAEGR